MVKQRRSFTTDFKCEAALLVIGQGYTIIALLPCCADYGAPYQIT